MEKIFLISALLVMCLTACSVDNGDEQEQANVISYEDSYAPMSESAAFEGQWTLDDKPVEAGSIVTCLLQDASPRLELTTFPYQAVAELLLPLSPLPSSVDASSHPPLLRLRQVGYSSTAAYYELQAPDDDLLVPISFKGQSADGTVLSVTLRLQPAASTCMVGSQTVNCIFSLKRIVVEPADGQPRQWVFNPERKLTFISTKRL